MSNIVGVLLACAGLFLAVWGPFGVRPAATAAGLLMFVGALVLLIDLPERS